MSISVEQSVRINRSPEEMYRFWRNFENLPRFMNHLESVQTRDDKYSHWVTTAPLGNHVEWDAEITDEQENQFIAWRSLEGAVVPNSGSVSFSSSKYEKGTEVKVRLDYNPPGGMVGAVIASFFGEAPAQQLRNDLWRLKQEIELGRTSL